MPESSTPAQPARGVIVSAILAIFVTAVGGVATLFLSGVLGLNVQSVEVIRPVDVTFKSPLPIQVSIGEPPRNKELDDAMSNAIKELNRQSDRALASPP